MSQVLGRGADQPWAAKWPVSSLGAMLIAAVVGIGIFTYCNTEMGTPLQQCGHSALHKCANEPDALGADLRPTGTGACFGMSGLTTLQIDRAQSPARYSGFPVCQ
jgi:hypothetical protein